MAREPGAGQVRRHDLQTAQTAIGALTQYRCLYKARMTYTATLITKPEPNKPAPKD